MLRLGPTLLLLAPLVAVIMGQEPTLELQPSGKIARSLGESVYVSCKANVADRNLVTQMKWVGPNGQEIPNKAGTMITIDDGPGELGLLIKPLFEQDTGDFVCTAVYAGNQNLQETISVESFEDIDFGETPLLQTPIVGEDAVIKCMVTANPSPQVDWLRDGVALKTGDRFIIQQDGVLIRDIQESDEGVYRCRARVAQLGTLKSVDIQVAVYSPPVITQPPQNMSGVEKEAVTLQCVSTGKPAPEYSWVDKESRPLEGEEGYYVDTINGELTILDLRPEQRGLYRCTATNPAGSATAEANLRVLTKPKLEQFLNVTADVDTTAEFRCMFSGDPKPNIVFQKETNPVPFTDGVNSDDRIEVQQTEDEYGNKIGIMKIHGVVRADDGLYTCTGESSGGVTVGWGHITVQYAPTFEQQTYDEFWSLDQEPVNLTCIATSIPNATVQWYLRNKEIPQEDQNLRVMSLGPVGILQVRPLDNSYFGIYTCQATNTLGTVDHDVELKQVHKPGPITSASVAQISATTITWNLMEPIDDGGRPITVFLVQYKFQEMSWDEAYLHSWTKGSSYSLDSLTPLRYYTFRFAAKNEVGTSEWSGEKTEQMPDVAVPEEPLIFVKSEGVNYIPYTDHYDLQWKAPLDNGDPISAFTVIRYQVTNKTGSWKKLGAKKEEKLDYPGPTTYTLRSLRPDTHYRVELRALNAIGYSQPAEIIIKTANDPNAPPPPHHSSQGTPVDGVIYAQPRLSIGIILAIVVAAIIVLAIVIDVMCFFCRDSGVTAAIGRKIGSKEKDKEAMLEPGKNISEENLSEEKKEPLKTPPAVAVAPETPSQPPSDTGKSDGDSEEKVSDGKESCEPSETTPMISGDAAGDKAAIIKEEQAAKVATEETNGVEGPAVTHTKDSPV